MTRAILVALALVIGAWPAHAQSSSADELARRTIERRAVEAVLGKTSGKVGQVIYWGRPQLRY
jgi:hypothetical protein